MRTLVTSLPDLDVLVHVPEGSGLLALGRFTQELQDPPHVPVDVVPDDSRKLRVRDGIARDWCHCEQKRPGPAVSRT